MRLTLLLTAALLGCPASVSESRQDTAGPRWEPRTDDFVEVDSGQAPDPDQPSTCFDASEVDTSAAATLDAGVWLPAGPDFDFDHGGYVVTMVGEDLVRFDGDGLPQLVLRVGTAWGIRSVPSGELVISRPELGMTAIISHNGTTRPFLGGMRYPTGLEVGVDGMVYIADEMPDGEVWMADPTTGEVAHVVDVPFPSGLALSPDEETLYIATSPSRYRGPARIAAVSRGADGRWDRNTLREVLSTDGRVTAMTTDLCGNLYVGEHDTARVFRIPEAHARSGEVLDQAAVQEVAQLGSLSGNPQDPPSGLTALRFGAGVGSFAEDTLYASSGGVLVGLAVGVDGRHVLSSP